LTSLSIAKCCNYKVVTALVTLNVTILVRPIRPTSPHRGQDGQSNL